MKIIDFIKPKTIEKTCSLLDQLGSDAVVTAGGTAFQFHKKDTEKTAVDINSLDLDGIEVRDNEFCIGALTKISEMRSFSKSGWVLNEVAKKFSTQQIRNMSTLGGNIAQIFPWSDFPVALLVLDAEINTVNSKGSKTYSAVDFFKQQPTGILKNKTLITDICVSKVLKSSGFGYHKEVRTSGGFSTLTVAAYIKLENNTISQVRLAVGGALGLPVRLTAIESALKGQNADSSLFMKIVSPLAQDIKWQAKEGASDDYIGHLAKTIIVDVLNEALKESKSEER